MLTLVRLRNSAMIAALACAVLVQVPLAVRPAPLCNVAAAVSARANADGLRVQRNFADAARWYFAAGRSTEGCNAASAALLGVHSLVQSSAAYAETGDYLRALAIVREARSRLVAMMSRDRRAAAAARADLDSVDDLVAAINTIAQASM